MVSPLSTSICVRVCISLAACFGLPRLLLSCVRELALTGLHAAQIRRTC